MMGKRCLSILLILMMTILCDFCNGSSHDNQAEEEDAAVDISPLCAAALLSGGALGGAGLVHVMTPTVLCTAGFCPVGVSGSSFASWWQSTMPLVSSGTLFATLQSAAMGGVGTKVAVTGGVLGSSLSRKHLRRLCAFVDDPPSEMASSLLEANLKAVQGATKAAEKAKAACTESETCAAAAETLSSTVSSLWNHAVQTAEAMANSLFQLANI